MPPLFVEARAVAWRPHSRKMNVTFIDSPVAYVASILPTKGVI
jgi:hypothetical protein